MLASSTPQDYPKGALATTDSSSEGELRESSAEEGRSPLSSIPDCLIVRYNSRMNIRASTSEDHSITSFGKPHSFVELLAEKY